MGQTLAGGVSWLSVGTGLDVPELGALSEYTGASGGSAARAAVGSAATENTNCAIFRRKGTDKHTFFPEKPTTSFTF